MTDLVGLLWTSGGVSEKKKQKWTKIYGPLCSAPSSQQSSRVLGVFSAVSPPVISEKFSCRPACCGPLA